MIKIPLVVMKQESAYNNNKNYAVYATKGNNDVELIASNLTLEYARLFALAPTLLELTRAIAQCDFLSKNFTDLEIPTKKDVELVEARTEPNFDLDAECAILAACMLECKDDRAPIFEQLAPSDFYDPRNYAIYNCIKRMHENNEMIDTLTVRTALQQDNILDAVGGVQYVKYVLEHAKVHNDINSEIKRLQRFSEVRNDRNETTS